MASTPLGNPNNIMIGQAVVYIGDVGDTPTTDVGYLGSGDDVSLSYETQFQDVTAGFPATSVRRFVTAVSVGFSFSSIEWNLALFNRSVQGVLTTTATEECLAVGISACPSEVSLRAEFCDPCGDDTFTICIYRAQTDGAINWNLGNGGVHTFNYNFGALLSQEDWDAAPLAANEGLFKIKRTIGPT